MSYPWGDVSAAWDREYRSGRYIGEPPVPFVRDIIATARSEGLLGAPGLYIGCGNGRNFTPLVDAGLDLTGLDVSRAALLAMAERAPELENKLVHGDLSALPPGSSFKIVVGIQVFQHGSRETCHEHIREAQRLIDPGGILALRVNAADTDIEYKHELVERQDGSGYTIRYLEGPKEGLLVHFFDVGELEGLFADEFRVALPVGLDSTRRQSPRTGQWSQWEGIWMRES